MGTSSHRIAPQQVYGSNPMATAGGSGISPTLLGAPEGIAQLDGSQKIRLDQLQMAQETRDRFDEVEGALPTDPGDLTILFDNQIL